MYNFDREGPGGADVYILCLEEFRSVGMLPPGWFQHVPDASTWNIHNLRSKKQC